MTELVDDLLAPDLSDLTAVVGSVAARDIDGDLQNQLAVVLQTEGERVRHISELGGKGATLSPARFNQFLEKARTMSAPAYVALFGLTAGSGIRVDEARHIDTGDLDDVKGRLTITPKKNWTSKGYRYRVIPVSKATLAAARTFIGLRDSVSLDDKSVWDEVQRVRTAAELIKFSLHDLRRAWASAVHFNGASLKQVSTWLGHSAIAVTERYIRLLDGAEDGHRFLPR